MSDTDEIACNSHSSYDERLLKELGKPGEYIYLIQERESIRMHDNVYKIGMTKQEPNKRMNGYPTNSKLFLTIIVDDARRDETNLKHIFNTKFARTSCGDEYYEGDPIEMMNTIIEYQQNHFSLENVNNSRENECNNKSSNTRAPSTNMSTKLPSTTSTSTKQLSSTLPPKYDIHKTSSFKFRSIQPLPSKINVIHPKPIELQPYLKAIAGYVDSRKFPKYKASARIYMQLSEDTGTSAIFDVDYVVIFVNDQIIEELDLNNDITPYLRDSLLRSVNSPPDPLRIELRAYHYNRFNTMRVNDIDDYIVDIPKFDLIRRGKKQYYVSNLYPNRTTFDTFINELPNEQLSLDDILIAYNGYFNRQITSETLSNMQEFKDNFTMIQLTRKDQQETYYIKNNAE